MAELLLELFSEEIPARMQARAAEDLQRLVAEAVAGLAPAGLRSFAGPRRIAVTGTVNPAIEASTSVERGPRISAPEQALTGFLRKHGVSRDAVAQEGDYWILQKQAPARDAASLLSACLPGVLRRFPWPKSMRWGATGSLFTWIRPLRRILCLLDGAVVPFSLAEGGDDGHGLAASAQTEGHRFMAPGAFTVQSAAEWQSQLLAHRVMVDAAERRRRIAGDVAALADERGLQVVDDPALLDEVAGLVEWPVSLLGRIDPVFMNLPAEVMQVSMRVNQRYFALRHPDGRAAPFFAFAANIEAPDGGAAIVAGNERVLRARFADARHFWDADRKTRLVDRVAGLDAVTFHAKLGSQGARANRLMQLAEAIAPFAGADPALAARAAWLSKADLLTGMVGEFPELQGVMGRYYALHDGEDPAVADAIRDHYAPRGPADAVPSVPVSVAAALADKIDLLASFFAVGEVPTGSGDPFALRRAALGIVRILRSNDLRLRLRPLVSLCAASLPAPPPADAVLAFIVDRARVQLRSEGARHDVLDAVFAAGGADDLTALLMLTQQLGLLLATPEGESLLIANKRAANILRIETEKDGPHDAPPDPAALVLAEETVLNEALDAIESELPAYLAAADFAGAMHQLSYLGPKLDLFFANVTVNDTDSDRRRNRLRLLHRVCVTMSQVADFSRIEG